MAGMHELTFSVFCTFLFAGTRLSNRIDSWSTQLSFQDQCRQGRCNRAPRLSVARPIQMPAHLHVHGCVILRRESDDVVMLGEEASYDGGRGA